MAAEPDPQMSGTAEGLIAFLEWASRKGELSPNTAASYKTAVTQVLEIDGEAWANTKILELDIERQLDRFARLRASRYNATSLRTYGNRFKAATSHYVKYLEDPASFRAAQPKVTRPKSSDRPQAEAGSTASTRKQAPQSRVAPMETVGGSSDLVQYPFPLRSGIMAYLSLPRDLRRTEAQRIGAFVASLAIDPMPELGSGRQTET
ncbi:MAG TPA: hypothetical protein VGG38_08635 [Acidimicrobiales bacterium]|jgi:hypothetical protein